MNERRFRAVPACGFEQVQRSQSVDLEIQEGNGGGAVMRGLGSGVNDETWANFADQREYGVAVSYIERLVTITGYLVPQAFENP